MTSFLAAAAAMLATTLFLLLRPLMRGSAPPSSAPARAALNLALLREQLRELDAEHAAGQIDVATYALAREELQQRVAEEVPQPTAGKAQDSESRWPAIAVGMLVPVLAAWLYILIGAPMALAPVATGVSASHETADEQAMAMVERLAERLKAEPANAAGWQMLARSYNVLGRYRDAAEAYRSLLALVPDDAAYYADYADALAMAQGQSLQGEPEKFIDKALAIDASNLKALALSGSAAFERGDFEQAIARWEKLVALAPPGSDVYDATVGGIAHAKKLLARQQAPGARTAAGK